MREWARTGLLAAAGGLAPRRAGEQRHDAPRVLLLRPDHLGDVLLTTPAIAALRAALPAARLTALVGPWSAEVLAANPHLDAVRTLRFPGFDRDSPPAGWRAYTLLARTARRLRTEGFDAAINLRPDFWWGAALLALAGIPLRVGAGLPPGERALSHRVPPAPHPEHAARQALRLADAAARTLGAEPGAPPEDDPAAAPLVFPLAAADREWAAGWLAARGLDPADAADAPIVLHPGAGATVKLWPARLWARTVETLARESGAPIVVAGRREEAGLVGEVASRLRPSVHVYQLVEDMPLARYAALLARARLVLGADSGPLHLAAAVGTPSVRLHGPSDPRVFGPWGPPELHRVVASDLPCAPCGRLDYAPAELAEHPCLRLVAPEAVLDAARLVLAAHAAGPPGAPDRERAAPGVATGGAPW